MKAQPSLSSSFGTSEYGLKAFGEFLLALVLLDLGNDDLLPVFDDEIRFVVGVFSFEGEDSRGDHSVRKLVGFDAKISCHAPELFRPAFHSLASLRPLLNLKDHLQICFARPKRSLELFELLLGLAVLALLQRDGPSNGSDREESS